MPTQTTRRAFVKLTEFHTTDAATLHPRFNSTLSNQPYYVIMSAK